MNISIVIVNWRSKEYLRKCLASIYENQDGFGLQIIVADAGSFDGCQEMLKEGFPDVEFVQIDDNVGFGAANNIGFKSVKYSTLLLLNPDTELRPGSLKALADALTACRNAGAIGARLLNSDGSFQSSCVRALPTPLNKTLDSDLLRRLFPRSRLWGLGDVLTATSPAEVEAISGACMFMESKTFSKVGGFSPEFFMYGEDMDLCAKIRRQGRAIFYAPEAVIVHHGGASSSLLANRFSVVMLRCAAETYMRLHHGRPAALSYRILQGLSALARLPIFLALLASFSQSKRSEAVAGLKRWTYVLQWAVGVCSEKRLKHTRKSA